MVTVDDAEIHLRKERERERKKERKEPKERIERKSLERRKELVLPNHSPSRKTA